MSYDAADYAAECQREADMVTVQSDNRFLQDLHQFRAELAAMESEQDNHYWSECCDECPVFCFDCGSEPE